MKAPRTVSGQMRVSIVEHDMSGMPAMFFLPPTLLVHHHSLFLSPTSARIISSFVFLLNEVDRKTKSASEVNSL